MVWQTHFASGALLGYYITNDWVGAVVGGVGAIISDLDEPESKFGKYLLFISYPLNVKFGHRTLTHSLPFAIACFLILMATTLTFWMPLCFSVGIVAHAIGDMLTGKVQFLYPFRKKYGLRIPFIFSKVIDAITFIVLMALIIYETFNYLFL